MLANIDAFLPGLLELLENALGLIEPMGSNKIVWLDASGTQLAMQTEPSVDLVSGAEAHLAMDPAHAHG